jgi:hypothetical protein
LGQVLDVPNLRQDHPTNVTQQHNVDSKCNLKAIGNSFFGTINWPNLDKLAPLMDCPVKKPAAQDGDDIMDHTHSARSPVAVAAFANSSSDVEAGREVRKFP